MSKIFKVCKIAFNILFYLLLIAFLVYAINVMIFKYLYHEELPRVFNYYIFNIESGSMEATLKKDDYIIVKKANDFDEGDIVTFKKDNHYVTHRIIKIDGDDIITKGDANNIEDDKISEKDIIGKYICKSIILSILIKYRMPIIGLILLSFAINYFIDLIKKNRVQENKL